MTQTSQLRIQHVLAATLPDECWGGVLPHCTPSVDDPEFMWAYVMFLTQALLDTHCA